MTVAAAAAVGTAVAGLKDAVAAAVGAVTGGSGDTGKGGPAAAPAPDESPAEGKAAADDVEGAPSQRGSCPLFQSPVVLRVEVASKASAQVFTWIVRLVRPPPPPALLQLGSRTRVPLTLPLLLPLSQVTALFCGLALSLLSVHGKGLMTVGQARLQGGGAALPPATHVCVLGALDGVPPVLHCCRLCDAAARLLQG